MKSSRVAAVLVGAALIGVSLWFAFDKTTRASEAPAANSLATAVQPAGSRVVAAPPDIHRLTLGDMQRMTSRLANPLETGRDLRQVYDQFRDSDLGYERSFAYRAWTACYPQFLSATGHPVELSTLARALPQDAPDNKRRLEAYATLRQRCEPFFSLGRDEILALTQRQDALTKKGEALDPGDLAVHFLRAGDRARALGVVRSAIESADPYALASLREFVHQYLVAQVDAQVLPNNTRTDIRSLAFAVLACELGLDCGPQSLTALQLCAHNGFCNGTVADRYAQSLGNDGDRQRLGDELNRVRDAIRQRDLTSLGLID